MRPVVTVSLNGNAYQIEQGGHDALRRYLTTADARLAANPDRAEILADLEQAIAEKCSRFLGPHKSVVTDEDMEQVLREMGPVDGGAAQGSSPDAGEPSRAGGAEAGGTQDGNAAKSGLGSKRLFRIREGEVVSGVCTGLAAYFGIDISIVRGVFIVLAILTWGAWVLVYLVMTILIPYAETAEQRAAAQGWQFNAQELIDRAKAHYAQSKDGQRWRRQWRAERRFFRAQQREWRARARAWRFAQRSLGRAPRGWECGAPEMSPAAHVLGGLVYPLVALFNALLLIALVLAIVSLFTSHAILGWTFPPQLPIWVGILALVALYLIVAAPLRAASHFGYYGWWAAGPYAMWGALVWIGVLCSLAWLAWLHWPAVQHFLSQLSLALQGLGSPSPRAPPGAPTT